MIIIKNVCCDKSDMTQIIQHTSSGCSSTSAKFSSLTSADQSPLTHSDVQEPSVSLASGTISMNSNLHESSVSSTCNCSSVTAFAGEFTSIFYHETDFLTYHKISYNVCNTYHITQNRFQNHFWQWSIVILN